MQYLQFFAIRDRIDFVVLCLTAGVLCHRVLNERLLARSWLCYVVVRVCLSLTYFARLYRSRSLITLVLKPAFLSSRLHSTHSCTLTFPHIFVHPYSRSAKCNEQTIERVVFLYTSRDNQIVQRITFLLQLPQDSPPHFKGEILLETFLIA